MKTIYSLIVFLVLVSCQKETPVDYAVISGNITNSDVEELKLNIEPGNDKIIEVKDGKFQDTLRLKSGIYDISDGKNRLHFYTDNGFNVNMDYDYSNFKETLSFQGKGAAENQYIFESDNLEKEVLGNMIELFTLEEKEFKKKMAEYKSKSENNISENTTVSSKFAEKEKRHIKYTYMFNFNAYERGHRAMTKNPEFVVSDKFNEDFEAVDYENEEDFLYSADYSQLVMEHFYNKAEKLTEEKGIDEYVALLKSYEEISNETIRNKLSYEAAHFAMSRTENPSEFFNLFKEVNTNPENIAVVKTKFNESLKLAKGNPSPKFTNFENYSGGTTSLDDLKGKYVYIDLWATWCRPCLNEIPHLKEVEDMYQGKNIEFVSISIDNERDYEKWRTMVKEKELGGIQLFGGRKDSAQFRTDYMISGIPTFILIDPDGNIVSHTAPRPSNSELIDLFNSLNI